MSQVPSRTHLVVALEFAAGLISLVLAAMWMRDPAGPYEPYLVGAGLTFAATEAFRRYEGKLFKVEGVERTPAERVRHHESLRMLFTEEIERCKSKQLRKDVVIRHVNRVDFYPDLKDTPGISPWFKVGLLEAYHMGIRVGLQWQGLVQTPKGLRLVNYKKEEQSDLTALLIGEIPYDYIESVNVRGDEYYSFPHIYCHFANRGEPYKRLFFGQEVDMGHGHSYWKEIAGYPEVKINSEGGSA